MMLTDSILYGTRAVPGQIALNNLNRSFRMILKVTAGGNPLWRTSFNCRLDGKNSINIPPQMEVAPTEKL